MNWFKRKTEKYTKDKLVSAVTTDDEQSMLISTSTQNISLETGRRSNYMRRENRAIASIAGDGRTTRGAYVRNLAWPRPIIIPARMVPSDYDDDGSDDDSNFASKYAQQSAKSYAVVPVDDGDLKKFHCEWSRWTYRARCRVW